MNPVPRRLAVVLVALTTAACGLTNTGDPGTAAIVGDRSIPTSAVDANLDSIRDSDAFQQQAAGDASGTFVLDAQSQLVTALVRSEILRQVAERNDVEVSEAEVRQARDELLEQLGGAEELQRRLAEQGVPEDLFMRQLRDQQLQAALQEQIGADTDLADFVRNEFTDVPIRINPRYGTWDEATLAVTQSDPLAPAGGATEASGTP